MKKNILIISLLFLFLSCKRDLDKEKFGPETIIAPEDFRVSGFTMAPSSFIDLSSEDMFLNCSMSQRVEFKVVIKGLLSGAERTISGVGNFIDASNSLWNGDSDNLSIFRAGEDCSVELSFHGALKKYYDTTSIAVENVYSGITLINNFEGITLDKNGPNAATYGNYFDGTDIAVTDIKSDNQLKTPQGSQSLSFDGTDANGSFYLGGMYFYPSGPNYIFNGYNPDSLYLNAYVYSYGDNSAKFTFTFSEDDNDINIIDPANYDKWKKDVLVEGQGWSLVSIRLKDFTDDNPAVGNGTINLDRIKGFNLNFNAVVAGTRARANVDYIVVSYGRPFEP